MLNITKKVTLTGETVIDGVSVAGYSASIDSDNPANMSKSSWENNKELYKQNRAICRKEAAEFEDTAYALQDEMIAEKEAESVEA